MSFSKKLLTNQAPKGAERHTMTTLHTLKQITKPSAADVKSARALTGLSQTAAAERIGAALRTWQAWEGGERNMPAAKWKLFLMLIE